MPCAVGVSKCFRLRLAGLADPDGDEEGGGCSGGGGDGSDGDSESSLSSGSMDE
jgi:hypothetical protein